MCGAVAGYVLVVSLAAEPSRYFAHFFWGWSVGRRVCRGQVLGPARFAAPSPGRGGSRAARGKAATPPPTGCWVVGLDGGVAGQVRTQAAARGTAGVGPNDLGHAPPLLGGPALGVTSAHRECLTVAA